MVDIDVSRKIEGWFQCAHTPPCTRACKSTTLHDGHTKMNGSNLEWSDVRVFLAIARSGTLGAVARMIGQTQPTMGRRLRALEESLGHVLFQRTSDGFILTDEGAAVLSYAERMEEEAL